MNQIGCECWQLIILARRPAIFDNYIPAFEVTGFAQTARIRSANASGDAALRNPVTGIGVGCCARAASGSVMNSRRFS
jgi:hypothetical protein